VREALDHFERNTPRGEVTLVIGGAPDATPPMWDERRVRQTLHARIAAGLSPAKAAAEVAGDSGWSRREVYRLVSDPARAAPLASRRGRSTSQEGR
jgi:16S rRNA (cytidine1402-2'-O)-methyltransferase